MKKGRFLVRWAGIVAVLATFSMYAIEAVGVVQAPAMNGEQRADILMIDTLKAFGKLEEAPVAFLHDQHTDALAKLGKKDCKTCHESDKDRLSPKFKRLKDVDKGTVKDIYHSGCISCHKDIAAQGKKSGPTDVSCRGCHNSEVEVVDAWKPIGMDKVLHWRHVDSKAIPKDKDDRNCASCHHEMDEQTKKLVYVKGKEGSCSYCHMEEAKDDVKSIRDASHISCVNCHVDVAAEKADSGPIKCAGCHGEAGQAKFEAKNMKITQVPRLERDQPDVVLMTVVDERALAQDKKGFMNPVAFNHKAHEEFNKDCKSCHHSAIQSCAKECHTLNGNEKGGFVTLEKAMHKVTSQASCIGCHNQRKESKECAGCHSLRPVGRVGEETCASCHDESIAITDAATLKSLSKEDKLAIAQTAVDARRNAGMYAAEDIPEKVVIADLVDQFEPSEFPHRKIVDSMFKKIEGSEMANYFHTDKGTFCQGCHHNSPPSKTPPRCASCHGKPGNGDERPGLKAAFHQQCIGCHKAMELEKPAATACADCHKERKK